MKVVIGISVFFLVAIGALGYYTFDLNREIRTLSDELTTYREEADTQVDTLDDILSDELTTFRGETDTQIGKLSDELTTFKRETDTQIGKLSDELTTVRRETDTEIGTLNDELKNVSHEISQSVINVSNIYERARKGVVKVFVGNEEAGSGFVFGSEGYIVTNHHLVEKAIGASAIAYDIKVDVILYDGTIVPASVVGSCQYSDIAVLKLEEELSLEPLELADSDDAAIGEPVLVIGNPAGLPETVASGIINQKGGFIAFGGKGTYYTANLIQYDAATNFGNSGGPLLNSNGKVIGLVVTGINPVIGERINYAISSNKVERVARSIIGDGSFDNPTLPGNWTLEDLTLEEASSKNLETAGGILVTKANATAIFEVDDIIVAIDGVTVRRVADLFNYLGEHKNVGDIVKLNIVGKQTKKEISVTLVEGGVVVR